ncbi:MAG TPA: serine/threonine-protein kinase, partial [Polyangiaceae bacterium]|nr:serine/threonine-protein kinase [Polyangiaceae bacterium]
MGQRQSIAPTLRPRLAPQPAESRYVVEASLASGGMGSVYRVRDQVSGRLLALKRLLPGSSSTAATLFRREYHTLARLRHPRIIEVYDYGVDARGPYYTMELLDGQDLRALAPLSYRKACLYLRDVASSLSLLHAQRVLHRDLTPANVRVTSDGRCKLIDFGALAPFGVAEALVGTPPYVPPEALRGLPLDQRADLFSLGALAYFLLTKKNAYPARSLYELESVWARRPAPPSARLAELDEPKPELAEIPATLDELVMSLLSADPLARPASAAEVIDRLDVIAQLDEDSEPTVAQSYLSSARLTGRTSELARAKQLASQALERRGAALVIEHDTGSGATRLLTELGLEARVLGLTVLQVDADVHRGPFAIAKAMAQKLAGALPQQARHAATADVLALGWLDTPSPDKAGPNLPPVDVTAAPGLWRVRVQAALERWFLDVADAKPLAIVVDNFQRVDEGSAALLALLAVAAPRHPLVIAVAQRKDEAALAPGISRRLLDAAERISLSALSLDESCALVASLFGDVPNVERVGRWLHRIASGYPHHLMELARYLVAHGLARYIDGTWVLPRELPPGLPARFEDTLDARLATLSASAFGLASALSVHEGPLSLELCASLSESHEEDPFAALAEL